MIVSQQIKYVVYVANLKTGKQKYFRECSNSSFYSSLKLLMCFLFSFLRKYCASHIYCFFSENGLAY